MVSATQSQGKVVQAEMRRRLSPTASRDEIPTFHITRFETARRSGILTTCVNGICATTSAKIMNRNSFGASHRHPPPNRARTPRVARHFLERDSASLKGQQEEEGREYPEDGQKKGKAAGHRGDLKYSNEKEDYEVARYFLERDGALLRGRREEGEEYPEDGQTKGQVPGHRGGLNYSNEKEGYKDNKGEDQGQHRHQDQDKNGDEDEDEDEDQFENKDEDEHGDTDSVPLTHSPSAGGATKDDLPSTYTDSTSSRLKNKATISDDRSVGSEYEATRRDLIALKPRENKITSQPYTSTINSTPVFASTGNHALQDLQLQLMLLEQQNKKRLMETRRGRDSFEMPQIHKLLSLESGIDTPTLSIPVGFGDIGSSRDNPVADGGVGSDTFSIKSDSKSSFSENLQSVMESQSRTRMQSSKNSFIENATQDASFTPVKPATSVLQSGKQALAKTHNQKSQLDILSSIVAHDLGLPDPSTMGFEYLKAYIVDLQEKAEALERLMREREPSKFQVIHRISQGTQVLLYFDAPQWTVGENSSRALRSSLPISSVPSYLDKHPELAFIVYRDYDVAALREAGFKDEEGGVMPQVKHTGESLYATSKELVAAVKLFLKWDEHFSDVADIFEDSQMISAPYLVIYHMRKAMGNFLDTLQDQQQRQFKLLLHYVLSEYRTDYAIVDSLLDMGKITHAYIKYLFRPGDILVEGKEHNCRGVLSKSWIANKPAPLSYSWGQRSMRKDEQIRFWEIDACSWNFSGVFSRWDRKLTLELDISDPSEIDIADLSIRPLAYVSRDMKDLLKRRGETFWKCRTRHFVSYNENKGPEAHHSGDDRYMIDLKTYRELHKSDIKNFHHTDQALPDDLGEEAMGKDTPPGAEFVYLVPPTIKGYNLKRKQWLELQVDKIAEVVWNKEAFQSLVLDRKTKGLIEALISNHLDAEKSTDLISGKGNGLILLLHGSPGTGKTLTAESVAEIAEKPLYPVTCGDIGTKPEEVEEYLESVLSLGKKWECVVLLDEADVFLEQRSLEDLRRNALVSVFLRVLEYYDGILVLTSNRVGTFDEAFKSRIQLALHYANLSEFQRVIIWRNFIERLERLKEEMVDFDDLKDNLEQLAKNKMNGRQIRNAITTARQYVKWKGESLNYAIMSDIIKTAGRFDLYIEKLNGGYSQDQLAEDEGLRLSEARAREV